MKIAINALAMHSLDHGVGNYIANLGFTLAKKFPDDQFTFFIRPDNTNLPKFLSDLPNANFEIINLPRPLRLLWEQSVLPFRSRSFNVLHSPVYVTPVLKLTRYVLTELDMTVFTQPEKYSFVKRIYFQLMIPLSVRRADKILAISNSAASDITSILKVPKAKITTTPLGVRDGLVRVVNQAELGLVRKRYHLPEKFVLFLGVLEPRKNVEGLVRAFAQISGQINQDLVIAGSAGFGWRNEATVQLVRDLGLEARIHFVGTVDEADKAALYSLSDVFAYPSFYEGFGIPVLEAMSCEVPVVTSKGSALEEVAGDAALLVDPNKPSEIARAILEIVKDTSIQNRLIKLGYLNVRRFSWAKTAELTYQAYDEKN